MMRIGARTRSTSAGHRACAAAGGRHRRRRADVARGDASDVNDSVVMVGGALDPVRDGFARSLGSRWQHHRTQHSASGHDGKAVRDPEGRGGTNGTRCRPLEATSRSSWHAAETAAPPRAGSRVARGERRRQHRACVRCGRFRWGGALLVIAAPHLRQRKQVVDPAAANRLPAMHSLRSFVDAGGLVSHGAI